MVLCHSGRASGASCSEPILVWSGNSSRGGKENCIRDIAFLSVMPASAAPLLLKPVSPKIEIEPRFHSGSNSLFLLLIGQILLSPSPQQQRCRRLPLRLPSRSCPRPRCQAGLWRSWRWRHWAGRSVCPCLPPSVHFYPLPRLSMMTCAYIDQERC